MFDYNLLTKKLLAEGYTAENYPSYVKIGGHGHGHGKDPLDNFDGGFCFTREAEDNRVYEFPCGMLCLGKSCFDNMSYMGVDWKHENDCPVAHCPLDCKRCELRTNEFRQMKGFRYCSPKPTERPYVYEGSFEQMTKVRDERIDLEKQAYLATHKHSCPHQMHYNEGRECWEHRYDPELCAIGYLNCSFCSCLGKELGSVKGNIYYDIELEGRDTTKDGTFFQGERIKKVFKGYQHFEKPVPLPIAEAALKVCKDSILLRARYNKLGKLVDPITLFRAEQGELDFRWTITNLRVEKKNVRDLEQDLADIDAGIKVVHVIDEAKKKAAEKKERRAKALDARRRRMRKKVLTTDLDGFEKKRAVKLLGEEEYLDLLTQKRTEKLKPKEEEHRQLSLFDLLAEG